MKKMIPLLCLVISGCVAPTPTPDPLASFNHAWEQDPAWYDGKAEVAKYDATRIIYDESRSYVATIYTNKEPVDAAPSYTKSADATGREAFKHHVREDIPTQNYNYHYSTMCYVGTKDLQSLKLDMGSQEDCGASYKQFIHHGPKMSWRQYSYFPDQGYRGGESTPPPGFVFQDALSVVLRAYPFDQPHDVTLQVMPEQTTTKWSPVEPAPMIVHYVGLETLNLPIGETKAHHLRVTPAQNATNAAEPAATNAAGKTLDYWFAADASAPMLHVMVKYDGPGGQTYALRSLTRAAYWVR